MGRALDNAMLNVEMKDVARGTGNYALNTKIFVPSNILLQMD
jgi:hypothetical protein